MVSKQSCCLRAFATISWKIGIFVLLVISRLLKPNLHLPNETLSVLAGVLGSLKKEFTNPGSVTQHNSFECINEVGPVLLAQAAGDPTV